MNGKKQIFLSLIESPDEVSCIAIQVCMVNGMQFEKEVKKNQVFFSIVPRGPNVGSNDRATKAGNDRVIVDSDSRVLEEIVELLNKYKNIVVDDIPNSLPLVRSISHCVDLIPRASFPNKA